MPFPFTLPTTSSVLLSDFFDSVTHPSLPLTATTRRSVLKDALKRHKRLPSNSKESNLPAIQDAANAYLPYLLALNAGSGYRDVGPEKLDVEVKRPLEVEWRGVLSDGGKGTLGKREKVVGLGCEIAFLLLTLGMVNSLLARRELRKVFVEGSVNGEQRTAAIAAAMKFLLEAHGIHEYLVSLPILSTTKDVPVNIAPSTVSALAKLELAEATIIVVAKDDPYTAAVAEDRDERNTDWMYKAPSIPKVRAHLYARICLAAAEHATSASSLLSRSGAGKVDEDLVKYAGDLRRTARGKAARFLAIDAELSGKTGEGLAWLKGAKKELGLLASLEDGKRKGFKGLKQSFQERREDRKVEKGGEWGLDAGRYEEGRVVEMLEAKWERENSTVNVQVIPAFEPLIASMPSGREYHSPQAWVPPTLDEGTFVGMRAPPEPDEAAFRGEEEDSGGEEDGEFGAGGAGGRAVVGAFPGTGQEYGRSGTSSSYY